MRTAAPGEGSTCSVVVTKGMAVGCSQRPSIKPSTSPDSSEITGEPLWPGITLWLYSNSSISLPRSEEHTSELQSRFDLVCRLLLEKKKIYINRIPFV